MKFKRKILGVFCPLDFVVFAIALLLIFFSFMHLGKKSGEKKILLVNSPSGEFAFDLKKNGVFEIPGFLGNSTIEISFGKAFFLDSPCPNKVCVQSFPLQNHGDWSACLPNQIFLHITSNNPEHDFDAVAF